MTEKSKAKTISGILGVLPNDWEGSGSGTVCLIPDADPEEGTRTIIPLGVRIVDLFDRSMLDFMGYVVDGCFIEAISALDLLEMNPGEPVAIKPISTDPRVGEWLHAGLSHPVQIIGRAEFSHDAGILFVEPDELFTSDFTVLN